MRYAKNKRITNIRVERFKAIYRQYYILLFKSNFVFKIRFLIRLYNVLAILAFGLLFELRLGWWFGNCCWSRGPQRKQSALASSNQQIRLINRKREIVLVEYLNDQRHIWVKAYIRIEQSAANNLFVSHKIGRGKHRFCIVNPKAAKTFAIVPVGTGQDQLLSGFRSIMDVNDMAVVCIGNL